MWAVNAYDSRLRYTVAFRRDLILQWLRVHDLDAE